MSIQIPAKQSLVLVSFGLFSLIFVGIIFSVTSELAVEGKEHASFLSWTIIAYVAGLSMIVLPCTLPLVFIIVPMSVGQGYKKGLSMALLFGAGLTITITLYGFGVASLGQTASLDQVSTVMFLIAGIAAFLFGLSQLKLINLKMPAYLERQNLFKIVGNTLNHSLWACYLVMQELDAQTHYSTGFSFTYLVLEALR